MLVGKVAAELSFSRRALRSSSEVAQVGRLVVEREVQIQRSRGHTAQQHDVLRSRARTGSTAMGTEI